MHVILNLLNDLYFYHVKTVKNSIFLSLSRFVMQLKVNTPLKVEAPMNFFDGDKRFTRNQNGLPIFPCLVIVVTNSVRFFFLYFFSFLSSLPSTTNFLISNKCQQCSIFFPIFFSLSLSFAIFVVL